MAANFLENTFLVNGEVTIEVFPNPIIQGGVGEVHYELKNPGKVSIQILDGLSGQLIREFNAVKKSGLANYELNTAELSSGLFLIRIRTPEYTVVRRVMIQ